jgi:hypothetical protein
LEPESFGIRIRIRIKKLALPSVLIYLIYSDKPEGNLTHPVSGHST